MLDRQFDQLAPMEVEKRRGHRGETIRTLIDAFGERAAELVGTAGFPPRLLCHARGGTRIEKAVLQNEASPTKRNCEGEACPGFPPAHDAVVAVNHDFAPPSIPVRRHC